MDYVTIGCAKQHTEKLRKKNKRKGFIFKMAYTMVAGSFIAG